MDSSLVLAILSAVGAGIVSSLGTVAALKVHITYQGKMLEKHDAAIERAHNRIDVLEKELHHH